ncbi:hypothetical protein EBU99_13070 [bacterium]|nr:hypothetical protein [bacterium]
MRYTMREFLWILISILCLVLLPWWQSVLISALVGVFLLRLTERGFKRRVVFLFIGLLITMITFHSSRSLVASAMSKLFKLPHYAFLAILSAGCFSILIALAAESFLWVKYSFRKVGDKLAPNQKLKPKKA